MDHLAMETAERPKRRLLPLLIVPLVAFLAGLAAMGWLLSRWDRGAVMLGIAPQAQTAPQPAAPPQMVVEPEPAPPAPVAGNGAPPAADPETVRRINLLEQRLAALDVQSRTAVGNADRAEGLLVAFAARRALDRGLGLGYLEALLRQRFEATQPGAVATILTEARRPVTLQQLQDGLTEVAPLLAGGGPGQSWWDAFRTELAGLVRIRRQGSVSTLPSERLRRAMRRLDEGQVDVALNEVLRLPGHARAAEWTGQASRYVKARRALDLIEAAALSEPRVAPQRPAPQPASQPSKPSGSY
jgi:hypothetical protein